MGDRCIADLDAEFFSPILELGASELCPKITDDSLGNSKSNNDALHELYCLSRLESSNWLRLDPLGEFVDGDQDVGKTPWCLLEWADHMEPPDCKGP